MIATLKSCALAFLAFFCMQSLADIAREEAERRRLLDQQGIEGKVIDADSIKSLGEGTLTTSTGVASGSSGKSSRESSRESSKDKKSIRSYNTAIQKLDRTIRQTEERLESRRARLRSHRWDQLKGGREDGGKAQARLQEEIEDLIAKLDQLRRERSEMFQSGRKAGYLPGELDGKGIIP